MRSLIAIVALVSAAVGAAIVLAVAGALGWIGKRGDTVGTVATETGTPAVIHTTTVVTRGSGRVLPAGFSPRAIYAARSAGVVTIFSYFGASSAAQGSGFVVSGNGDILTDAHVITDAGTGPIGQAVKPADAVYVEFGDHDRVRARIVGWDVYDDVGVLKVDPARHRLDVLPLGNSAAVSVGDPVAAIGSPLGNENSLAVGVVSAVHRSIASLTSRYQLIDAIQTDAAITHGNSGGPLLDARGRAIGINAQIRSQSGSGNDAGVGFAVPIDSARRSLRQLLKTGHVRYAFVGLSAEDLTPSLARRLHVPVSDGALIDSVTPAGPAAKAGIKGGDKSLSFAGTSVVTGGDVVVAIDGAAVHSADDLVRIVTTNLEPGTTAAFTIIRDGQRHVRHVRLADRPANPHAP